MARKQISTTQQGSVSDDDFLDEKVEDARGAVVPYRPGAPLIVGGLAYEVEAIVTRSVLRQELGKPFFIEFESAIYEAPPLDTPSKMAPPNVANVINLQTGECQLLICNTVLQNEIERAYPNQSYVGKAFACCGMMAGRESNDYRVYNIRAIRPKG